MKITIISPNKIAALYQDIIKHFIKMLSDNVEIKTVELKKKLPPGKQMEAEAVLILQEVKSPAYIIAMDQRGKMFSSEQFADSYAKFLQLNKNVYFIIGGPYGLDKSVISAADQIISLSPMTLPNQLAITMLIEQLYRAESIRKKHPYHK